MKHLNKVTLIGTIDKEPEVTTTQTGAPIGKLSLVTIKEGKKRTGEEYTSKQWHRIVYFGDRGRFSIGQDCYVEGSLQTRKYQDKQSGMDKYITEIMATEIIPFVSETNSPKQKELMAVDNDDKDVIPF